MPSQASNQGYKGNVGIWQMFTCSPLTDTPVSWQAMRAMAGLSLLSNLVAMAALVAHVTIVRPEKRKASLRTFTIAAYISVVCTLLLVVTFAARHSQRTAFLSYSFGFTLLGTIFMTIAAALGTCKANMY